MQKKPHNHAVITPMEQPLFGEREKKINQELKEVC